MTPNQVLSLLTHAAKKKKRDKKKKSLNLKPNSSLGHQNTNRDLLTSPVSLFSLALTWPRFRGPFQTLGHKSIFIHIHSSSKVIDGKRESRTAYYIVSWRETAGLPQIAHEMSKREKKTTKK